MSLVFTNPAIGHHADSRWDQAEKALALITAVIIGSRLLVYTQVTAGYLLSFALTPLWFPLVRRAKHGLLLIVAGFLALLNGLCLTIAAESSRPVNHQHSVIVMVELAGVIATAGAMFWAIKRLSLFPAVAGYGLGMLAFVNTRSALFSESPWRFGFALPVTILVLGLACSTSRTRPQILVLIGLCIASVLAGSRSPIAIQVLAFLFLWRWSLQGKPASRARSVVGMAFSLGLTCYAVYSLGEALLLEGFLGESAQQRTEYQVRASGTVILGGRPELGATVALMAYNPWGFGPGVLANWHDIQVARNGMAALGYDPLNGYVENFLFGDVIRLHSMVGEAWAAFGAAGIALAAVILWAAITAIAQGRRGKGDALVLVLAFLTLWNLFFSPWYTSISVLALLFPVVWLRSSSSGGPDLDPVEPQGAATPATVDQPRTRTES